MTDEASDVAPVAQSLEDRIASRFGGLPKAPAPEQPAEQVQGEEGEAEPDFAELEWEGEKFQVPKAVADKLKPALMANKDYTQKTQELAEQRRAVDVSREMIQAAQSATGFNESIATEQQELSVIDAYLAQAKRVDWSQMSADQMLRMKVEIDSVKERGQDLRAAIEAKRVKFQEEFQAKLKELKGKARDIAAKKIDGFSEQTETDMRQWAVREGFTEAEVEQVLLHPLSAVTIWKAMQFDKVKAGTSKAAERATKAPPSLKPGAASERMPQNVASKLNFHKAMKEAGSDSRAKEKVIEQRLTGLFGK